MGDRELLASVERFARERVAPAAAAYDDAMPDVSLYADAAAIGLTRLEVPVAQGGLGHGFALKARACEIVAAADFGFAMSLVNTHNIALRIARLPDKALRETHLPGLLDGSVRACTAITEPGAGSDAAAITTTARRVAQGWELTGEKCWIVNGAHAGLSIVYAQCGEAGDGKGIGAFLVDLTTPGCTRYAMDSGFAKGSIGTGGFRLEGVTVPDNRMLSPPGEAFRAILSEINGARTYVAAMACGMLDAAIEHALDYGARRESFGKPLTGHQAWRLAVAEAATDLAAARALTNKAIDTVDTGADAQLLAAQAKVFAVATCQHRLPILLTAMGAEGLKPQYPFTRHIAAIQSAALTDGTAAMLLERVAHLVARSNKR